MNSLKDPADHPRNDESDENKNEGIYAPPRRRGRSRSTEKNESRPGLWGRITGRHRLEEIREERYRPYTYESNEQNIKWTASVMLLWTFALIWLAWTDFSNVRTYRQWLDQGIEAIPPNHEYVSQIENARIYALEQGGDEMRCAYLNGNDTTADCPDGELPSETIQSFIEDRELPCVYFAEDSDGCAGVWTSRAIIEFANTEGINCPDANASYEFFFGPQIETPEYTGCGTVFDIASQYQASQDRSRLIWLLVMITLLIVAFPYLSAIHRASRNLLTLKSEEQKHRPEWAVLHHFIPVCNLFQPGRVIRELFKGSDPNVTLENTSTWKTKGKVHPIAYLWWLLWVVAIFFNPILIPRFFGITNMEDLIRVNTYFVYSDLLLIILGAVAILMLRQLHTLQQMRFEKVGPITVTPPMPQDPLQEALKERENKQENNTDKTRNRR